MSTWPAFFLWLLPTLPTLAALGLLYAGGLRAEPCLRYNRALLLLAPLLAALLPLLPRPDGIAAWLTAALGVGTGTARASGSVGLPEITVIGAGEAAHGATWAGWPWLLGAYGLGVALLLGRLVWRTARLRQLARQLPIEIRSGYRLARTGGRLPTSSFGRTVFWDETAALTPAEAAAVLAHELAHVRQRHSLDVLWLEAWRAVLWPNPFAHWLLPAARLTHELLADRAAQVALASAAEAAAPAPPSYPTLLARLAARPWLGPAPLPLLLPFTFSFTLARLAMLQNPKSVRRWKQVVILPLLGGLLLTVGCPALAQTTPAGRPAPANSPRQALLMRNIREALRQDSLTTGGPNAPANRDKTRWLDVNRDGTVRVGYGPRPQAAAARASTGARTPTDSLRTYTYVEQMPALTPGGTMLDIMKAIQQKLVYPDTGTLAGRVFASFTVGADGLVRDSRIIKGLSDTQDAAVLAAIGQLPRFVPGRQSGRTVAVSFTVPVTFTE